MTVVIATTNRNKLIEIRRILGSVPFTIDTIFDHTIVAEPEETGTTFTENARLKARHYGASVPYLTVAEDSGLEIDCLDGAPGIQSSRFPGESYPRKFDRIYEMLRDRGVHTSSARFVCAVTAVESGKIIFETTGTIEGRISDAPRGSGGFGYDPIFFYPPFGCTFAEITAERKTAISHRGQAFRKLRTYLNSRNEAT